MQIFDELRRVGARHDLSAGLLIGGKGVHEEQERVNGARAALRVQSGLLPGRHGRPGDGNRLWRLQPRLGPAWRDEGSGQRRSRLGESSSRGAVPPALDFRGAPGG